MPPIDKFSARSALGSAREGFAITPGTQELAEVPRALWVGGGGNVAVKFNGGDTLILKNIQSGTLVAISPSHVLAAGTTATDILGLV